MKIFRGDLAFAGRTLHGKPYAYDSIGLGNIATGTNGGFAMDRVSVDLKNCYGIKALKHVFDFSNTPAFAVYAPNGSMKSSLARTFQDAAKGQPSSDRIFPTRATERTITDENNGEIEKERVLVVLPYDDQFGPSEKTCTLLVDAKLREEYTSLYLEVDEAKDRLIGLLKQQSKSKADLAVEISSAFTPTANQLQTALTRIQTEILDQKDTPLANVEYDKIFAEAIVAALNTKNLKQLIADYINRYNELLAALTYFKKGTFDYYNASEIAKSLADNGFFKANHTVSLNAGGEALVISTQNELEDVITSEKEAILKDEKLAKSFDEVAKQLDKNKVLREFKTYLMENEAILSQLDNIDKFKEDVLKSYIKVNEEAYLDLMKKYDSAEGRRKEIQEEARKQRTQWEEVIEIFNDRFVVPFKLEAKNRVAVILGDSGIIDLGFTYHDGADVAEVNRPELLQSLSTGEQKALYVLNVIFEIQTRMKTGQETLVVVDDIADSFDYQNKYAIIQYLKDISEEGLFKQLILTHNFDFFRTAESRFVGYANCLMAAKSDKGITLNRAAGIKNIFVNDWKGNFFVDDRKKIASIPFLRNLSEYTKGETDPDYLKLTSMLHWKPDTVALTVGDLDAIYGRICEPGGPSADPARLIYDLIGTTADACLTAPAGMNFENKIVLAIAIRMRSERYMADKIADPAFLIGIAANQTQALISKFKETFPKEIGAGATLSRVALMTPENIHLNSFMYEPIIDMGEDHLRKLFEEVKTLA